MSQQKTKYRFDISDKFPIKYHKDDKMFTAFASDLGFGVGEWPKTVVLFNSETGNELNYHRTKPSKQRGEVKSVTYVPETADGLVSAFSRPADAKNRLEIWND